MILNNRYIFLFLLSFFTQATASDKDIFFDTGMEDLPTEAYQRKNVAEQNNQYRLICDSIYQNLQKTQGSNESEDAIRLKMPLVHESRYLSLFKDGILIVRDYIHSPLYKPESRTTEDQRGFLKQIGRLWTKAQALEITGTLSMINLCILNEALTYITSSYKREKIPYMSNGERYAVPDADELFEEMESRNKQLATRHRQCLIASIYAHPSPTAQKRELASDTLLDQYAQGKYPLNLAFVDIHSTQKKKGTKKDAHYSTENGTYNNFVHDQTHAYNANGAPIIFETIQAGYRIVQGIENVDQFSRERYILKKCLFILYHETSTIFKKMREQLCGFPDAADRLKLVAQNFMLLSFKESTKVDDEMYKDQARDRERVLNAFSFLPTVMITETKGRVLPIAQQGAEYFVIEKQTDFKPGMTWVMRNADAPLEIRQKRHDLQTVLLKNATKHFWDCFVEILNKHGLQDHTVTSS